MGYGLIHCRSNQEIGHKVQRFYGVRRAEVVKMGVLSQESDGFMSAGDGRN
jgi:hypothetical protein